MNLAQLVELNQLFALISSKAPQFYESKLNFVHFYFNQKLSLDKKESFLDSFASCSKPSEDFEDQQFISVCQNLNNKLDTRLKFVFLADIVNFLVFDNQYVPSQLNLYHKAVEIIGGDKKTLQTVFEFGTLSQIPEQRNKELLILSSTKSENIDCQQVVTVSSSIESPILALYFEEYDLFLLKNLGVKQVFLGNEQLKVGYLHYFGNGGVLYFDKNEQFLFSQIKAFIKPYSSQKLCLVAKKLDFSFYKNQKKSLNDFNIVLEERELVGIIGSSGSGKSTLLNVLGGIYTPSGGQVLINGINLHRNPENLEGIIGYVGQEDVFLENLSVYENLYYNAKLCFGNLSKEELGRLIDSVLVQLQLQHVAHLEVGDVLNNKISGGQRKRVMIALELMREPSILFLDEPTSGLSSSDAKNVIKLLKELSIKGKLIVVVIHQPTNEVFYGFDKLIVLDTGGYPIFIGTPTEFFKCIC
jgi:ABC transport system ATP-binding/permease protein